MMVLMGKVGMASIPLVWWPLDERRARPAPARATSRRWPCCASALRSSRSRAQLTRGSVHHDQVRAIALAFIGEDTLDHDLILRAAFPDDVEFLACCNSIRRFDGQEHFLCQSVSPL